jgi:hypothetical protein
MYSYDASRSLATHYPEHFWSPSYTTRSFHFELIQTYYRSSTFVFSSDGGLIKRFLSTDAFQLGFPPSNLVSNIEIQLSSMTFDRTSCVGYMFGVATKPEVLVGALEGVEDLKRGARVLVRLETRGRDGVERERQGRVGCEALVPRLREVGVRGVRVRLEVDGLNVGLDDETWVRPQDLQVV